MAPFRWLKAALSRRSRGAESVAPSLAKSKRRKLPRFKGFDRSASTTQLVSLGGLSSSAADENAMAEAEVSGVVDSEDWRIEPVPPVAAISPAEAAPPLLPAGKNTNSSLAVAKGWYLATHCALALFPFPAIYLSDRGLSSVEIGTILALRPFISAVAGAFLCMGLREREEREIGRGKRQFRSLSKLLARSLDRDSRSLFAPPPPHPLLSLSRSPHPPLHFGRNTRTQETPGPSSPTPPAPTARSSSRPSSPRASPGGSWASRSSRPSGRPRAAAGRRGAPAAAARGEKEPDGGPQQR